MHLESFFSSEKMILVSRCKKALLFDRKFPRNERLDEKSWPLDFKWLTGEPTNAISKGYFKA